MELKYDRSQGEVLMFLEYQEIAIVLPFIEATAVRMRDEGFNIPDLGEAMTRYMYKHRDGATPLIICFAFEQLEFALNVVRNIIECERMSGNNTESLESFLHYVQHEAS